MKKLMIGLAAAGFGALLAIGGAQAQDTKVGTGTGADARMKNAPTAAAMGHRGARVHHYRRHHVRHYAATCESGLMFAEGVTFARLRHVTPPLRSATLFLSL